MTLDFAIIGTRPAGSILAWKLPKLNFRIALVGRTNSKKNNKRLFFTLCEAFSN